MFWIHEKIFNKYLNSADPVFIKGLLEAINTPIHRVKDTGLTYRQINSLDESGMIISKREKGSGWRPFSLKDIVYLSVIDKCRKYGLNNDLLQELKADFYTNSVGGYSNDIFADHAITVALLGSYKISLIINERGNSWFADVYYQAYVDRLSPSYLCINFNELVTTVWERVNGTKIVSSYADWMEVSEKVNKLISPKEKLLLEIVRSQDYSEIKVSKREKNYVVYAEAHVDADSISEIELVDMIRTKDFGEITIKKRKGKPVRYTREDMFKI